MIGLHKNGVKKVNNHILQQRLAVKYHTINKYRNRGSISEQENVVFVSRFKLPLP